MTMKHIFSIILGLMAFCQLQAQSWTADNGNGTFTNPTTFQRSGKLGVRNIYL